MQLLTKAKIIINDALLKTINEVLPLVKSRIATLTYYVNFGPIFVEYFMNKTKNIIKIILMKQNS